MTSTTYQATRGSKTSESLRKCPICQLRSQNDETLPLSRDQWVLKECSECSLVYLENPPPVESLVDDFNWTATASIESERRRTARPLLSFVSNGLKHWRARWMPRRKLDRLIRQYVGSGKLLDIGCGTAEHFGRIPASIIPYGIEIDSQAIETARKRASLKDGDVIHADALSGIRQFEPGSLSGIIMHSFLEHEVAPLELLRAAYSSLEKRGVVIIKVPNFQCWNRRFWRAKDWPGFRFPDHVNYFTPKSLEKLVGLAGLHPIRFNLWDRVPTSDNMWMVVSREPTLL